MKTLLTCITLLFCLCSTAQKPDYREMKDTICPDICGWRDSLTLTEIEARLLALDTNRLHRKSLYTYFYDLAMTEYGLYIQTSDDVFLRESAKHSEQAMHHDPKRHEAYWQAAFAYNLLRECEKTKLYLSLYKKRVPKHFLDESVKEQIKIMEAMWEAACSDQH